VESGKRKVESGKWKVERGKWKVESGKWKKVQNSKWKVAQSLGLILIYICGNLRPNLSGVGNKIFVIQVNVLFMYVRENNLTFKVERGKKFNVQRSKWKVESSKFKKVRSSEWRND
jgi:hypothetical protein